MDCPALSGGDDCRPPGAIRAAAGDQHSCEATVVWDLIEAPPCSILAVADTHSSSVRERIISSLLLGVALRTSCFDRLRH
jgi:hypothetical protein